ncbi:MAG: porin family protein [Bacteroidales bacterium]|nr:porin family protein [Bacteroidales bacterium]
MRTKIKKLSMLCLLFIAINIQAQEFNFGLSAGVDAANIRISNSTQLDLTKADPMIAFNLNAFAAYRSAGFWGITAEPGFIQKGANITISSYPKDFESRMQLNYIQLPLLADFHLTDKLFLSVGPEFAYLVSAKARNDDEKVDFYDYYDKKFEVSSMAAINYTVLPRIDIALRYSHGFTTISEMEFTNEMGEPTGEAKEKSQYLQLMVRARIFSSRQ